MYISTTGVEIYCEIPYIFRQEMLNRVKNVEQIIMKLSRLTSNIKTIIFYIKSFMQMKSSTKIALICMRELQYTPEYLKHLKIEQCMFFFFFTWGVTTATHMQMRWEGAQITTHENTFVTHM